MKLSYAACPQVPVFPRLAFISRCCRGAAFSLTEVVIALGIFAISMVGILALFPIASSTGRESSEETQAAIIAQTLLDDLRTSLSARGSTNGWIVAGSDTFSAFMTNVSLRTSRDYAVIYNVKLRDRADSGGGAPQIGPPIALKALASSPATAYIDRSTNPAAVYFSLVRVRPVNTVPNLAEVNVEVSTPASAPLANRRVFSFNTLMTAP